MADTETFNTTTSKNLSTLAGNTNRTLQPATTRPGYATVQTPTHPLYSTGAKVDPITKKVLPFKVVDSNLETIATAPATGSTGSTPSDGSAPSSSDGTGSMMPPGMMTKPSSSRQKDVLDVYSHNYFNPLDKHLPIKYTVSQRSIFSSPNFSSYRVFKTDHTKSLDSGCCTSVNFIQIFLGPKPSYRFGGKKQDYAFYVNGVPTTNITLSKNVEYIIEYNVAKRLPKRWYGECDSSDSSSDEDCGDTRRRKYKKDHDCKCDPPTTKDYIYFSPIIDNEGEISNQGKVFNKEVRVVLFETDDDEIVFMHSKRNGTSLCIKLVPIWQDEATRT